MLKMPMHGKGVLLRMAGSCKVKMSGRISVDKDNRKEGKI